MSQRKELITIEYHSDDETGMYHVGEIDFGVSGVFDDYVKRYGRKGIAEILQTMSHLIWHVQEYGYKICRENEDDSSCEANPSSLNYPK